MAEDEFPAPVDPPTVDVPVTSQEKEAQVTAVGKSTRPRLPVVFYRLLPKARIRAVREVIGQPCDHSCDKNQVYRLL